MISNHASVGNTSTAPSPSIHSNQQCVPCTLRRKSAKLGKASLLDMLLATWRTVRQCLDSSTASVGGEMQAMQVVNLKRLGACPFTGGPFALANALKLDAIDQNGTYTASPCIGTNHVTDHREVHR